LETGCCRSTRSSCQGHGYVWKSIEKKIFHFIDYKILLFKDDKRLPYYLKWADAVLITYSITQQDSFEMALAYLDAITSYSKSLSVSTNELVLMLLGNKLDLERIR
jgi:GTPase SAR1 family protein